ncbi:hypothetical protein [Streptomyces sp. NPDC057696]|uniref:hypothetical protein n=1 Tax=Streptomyces sp. NPDC057696 TaxID=3346218 RepID=UPI00367CC98A
MTKARVPSGGPGLSYVGRPAGPSAGRAWPLGVEVFDTATKKTPLTPVDKNTTYGSGQASLTDDGVTWVEDEDEDGTDTGRAGVKRAGLHGSGPATVLPEAREGALYAYELTASDDAVTELSLSLSLPPAPSASPATAVTRSAPRPTPARASCGRTARPAGRAW